jgi:hypothetical protein
VKSSNEGVSRDDIERAVNTEFKENEFSRKPIPSKIGSKLLDYEPENVVTIQTDCARRSREVAVTRSVI